MARGKIVKPEVKGLIIRVHLEHPKLKTREVRNIVESTLRTDEDYSALWPIPKDWPGLSTVQHILGGIRSSDEEQPWDISTLSNDHPIPPEALPTVLDIAMSSQERGQPPLTIREAKWIGRLYALIFAVAMQQGLDKVPIDFVEGMATFYATNERISELLGERLPATMDKVLWELLTKRELISEILKGGFNPSPDDDRLHITESGTLALMVTKEQRDQANKTWRKLCLPKRFGSGLSALGVTIETKDSTTTRE